MLPLDRASHHVLKNCHLAVDRRWLPALRYPLGDVSLGEGCRYPAKGTGKRCLEMALDDSAPPFLSARLERRKDSLAPYFGKVAEPDRGILDHAEMLPSRDVPEQPV